MWKFVIYQHSVLCLLWLAYCSSYLQRKPLALIKSDLMTDVSLSADMLGWLDVALLLPYAGVSLTMGWLADMFGARKVLGLGLLLSGICFAGIAFTNNFYIFCLLLFGTGASQALCWPAAGSILVKWFSNKERNYAFGIFGTSCFAGSVVATYFGVFLREACGWRGIFIPCGGISAAFGLLVLIFAHSPVSYDVNASNGKETTEKLLDEESFVKSTGSTSDHTRSLTFTAVMRLSLVPEVSLSILCMKCVRYAFLLWLPFFLKEALKYSSANAGICSTVFDLGGIVGSLANGFLVRKFFKNDNFLASSLTCVLTGVFMLTFFFSQDLSPVIHMILLSLAGLFNCTSDILLTGPIAASIGSRHHATVAVSGVVNGMGSVGSVLQGPVVAWFGATLGWMAVLPLLTVVAVLGGLASYRAYRISLKNNLNLII